jgi:uracil-DNA glycosylase family 4
MEESTPMRQVVASVRSHLEYLRNIGIEWIPKREGEGRAMVAPLTLESIREEMGDCKRCKLWHGRKNLVFGEGNPNASLMFVGEGPGADEDAQGRPFIGRAGQLLTKIIEAIDMERTDVYIANIVKSRPPNNRVPEPDEVVECLPFLKKQIAAIRPQIIVTLGAVATNNLLSATLSITKVRGEFRDMGGILVMPTFHPSYLLRNPAAKREVWEDMKKVRDRLGLIERSNQSA